MFFFLVRSLSLGRFCLYLLHCTVGGEGGEWLSLILDADERAAGLVNMRNCLGGGGYDNVVGCMYFNGMRNMEYGIRTRVLQSVYVERIPWTLGKNVQK